MAMGDAAKVEDAERARELAREADARLAEAQAIAVEAGSVEAVKTAEAIAAAKAAWSAEQASTEAAQTLKATERNAEPISIFVSRKAGRAFIRQAWAPIHDAPVTFKDADAPLGTHAYLAVAPDAGGQTLRWLTVSLPPSRPAPPRQGVRHSAYAPSPPAAATAAGSRPETADSVLERFELAEGTRAFIEDRLWTGAFLIVSDEGISPETGATTDFIVVTR
jgi:hypothetical protein